jgi:ABC-type uncharacterized transport system permease subunit
MLLGALASFLTSMSTGSPWLSLLVATLAGASAGLFLAWMYVTVRAEQVVAGLVFNVLAVGIAAIVYRRALGHSTAPQSIAMFQPARLRWLSDIPLAGPILFGQTHVLTLAAPRAPSHRSPAPRSALRRSALGARPYPARESAAVR